MQPSRHIDCHKSAHNCDIGRLNRVPLILNIECDFTQLSGKRNFTCISRYHFPCSLRIRLDEQIHECMQIQAVCYFLLHNNRQVRGITMSVLHVYLLVTSGPISLVVKNVIQDHPTIVPLIFLSSIILSRVWSDYKRVLD
jgi:hypothetical protein